MKQSSRSKSLRALAGFGAAAAAAVEKSGGTIAVKSSDRPGCSGTVFSIFLPLRTLQSVSRAS
jgi:hypothetical protein